MVKKIIIFLSLGLLMTVLMFLLIPSYKSINDSPRISPGIIYYNLFTIKEPIVIQSDSLYYIAPSHIERKLDSIKLEGNLNNKDWIFPVKRHELALIEYINCVPNISKKRLERIIQDNLYIDISKIIEFKKNIGDYKIYVFSHVPKEFLAYMMADRINVLHICDNGWEGLGEVIQYDTYRIYVTPVFSHKKAVDLPIYEDFNEDFIISTD